MDFIYQKYNQYFARVAEGLEEEGAKELEELGATGVKKVYRGLTFEASPLAMYRINYCSRLCSRVLAPLLNFDCHSTKYLHKTAMKIPWTELMDKDGTLAVSATVAQSKIKHSHYAALCLKDAVVDTFREKYGTRPDVDRREPDLQLNLHIERNRAVISIDTSGGSLHRRGYRIHSVEAPMQEILAAAIIRLSGWDGEQQLVDPMCGSGTLLCEALMHHGRIPAGFLRQRFGFEALPDFDHASWVTERKRLDAMIRPPSRDLIVGGDRDLAAIKAARENCRRLPNGQAIQLQHGDYRDFGKIENAVIICNPPYGLRIGRGEEIGLFMKEFGDFLKQSCTGSVVFLYFGKREMLKMIGLKPYWKKNLFNGGLDGVLAGYRMY
ncbi:MAG: class I SAM-dependent RNA methyltransferase [Proteobacteria bacterium]|nr:class I SAM-dependent RNA methyltransferase [Pseudomonadota bacterium]MBU1688313.1 class I SAM-dependent RNA methyltransferase [Pseudomonadota bacterium]